MWVLDRQHPSSEEDKESALGQSIKTSKDYRITRVKFRMLRTADAEGIVVAHLYASTGVYGVDSIPTGSPLAISNPINISTLLPYKYAEFTFPSNQQYMLRKDVVYCIELVVQVLTSGIVYVNNQETPFIPHAGNLSGWTGSDGGRWGYLADRDTNFYLYGLGY